MMLILGLMDIPHCWMQNLPGGGDKWNPPTQLCLGEHQQTLSWPPSSPQAHVAHGGAVMQRRQHQHRPPMPHKKLHRLYMTLLAATDEDWPSLLHNTRVKANPSLSSPLSLT